MNNSLLLQILELTLIRMFVVLEALLGTDSFSIKIQGSYDCGI